MNLSHVDSLIGENRADVPAGCRGAAQVADNHTDLTGRLDQTLDVNSENIDELLENLRHVSQNLKEFTNTIKTRPYTLIRSSTPREHKTGEPRLIQARGAIKRHPEKANGGKEKESLGLQPARL